MNAPSASNAHSPCYPKTNSSTPNGGDWYWVMRSLERRCIDARLVAAMHVHGLTHLLTLNVRGLCALSRYHGLCIHRPFCNSGPQSV